MRHSTHISGFQISCYFHGVIRGRNKGKVKITKGGKVKYRESLDLWFNYEGTKKAQETELENLATETPKEKKPDAPEPDVGSDPMIPDTAIQAIEDTFFENGEEVDIQRSDPDTFKKQSSAAVAAIDAEKVRFSLSKQRGKFVDINDAATLSELLLNRPVAKIGFPWRIRMCFSNAGVMIKTRVPFIMARITAKAGMNLNEI